MSACFRALVLVLAAGFGTGSAAAREHGGPHRAAAHAPTEGRTYVVAALGDSLTDPRAGGGVYVDLLRKRCPHSRFDALGVGGQQAAHVRWRLLHDVFGVGARTEPPQYTHLIVLAGVNDLSRMPLSGHSPARSEEHLAWIYATARRRGLQVVAVTVPPWTGLSGVRDARVATTHVLDDWIREQGALGNVADVVDVYDELTCGTPDVLCPRYRRFPRDLVHWNKQGHAVLAEQLFTQVFGDCA